jgi:drug/metabolite transporter (DMT)-like permease
MAAAGIAWGVYSLRGRGAGEPVAATAGNFLRATPFALALSLLFAGSFHTSANGLALAVASGALTSGLGYVLWYSALSGLTALRAASVQLSVPPLAAAGGVLLLSEVLSMRLMLSSATILGGISLVLFSRSLVARLRRA